MPAFPRVKPGVRRTKPGVASGRGVREVAGRTYIVRSPIDGILVMKREQIQQLFTRFEEASGEVRGVECWSARDLQDVLGYTQWRNFEAVIQKAREACEAAGEAVSDHFAGISKMVALGSGSERVIEDIALTRYACYLIAQNGDPAKPAIAFAQTYFAVQTRKQEVVEQRLLDVARVSAREKLVRSEKKLSGIIYERGVDMRASP